MQTHRFPATPSEQLKEIKKGTAELIPEEELLKKLEESYSRGKPLVVKFGADPSKPDLHLGHTVVINKLRLLQDLGHEIHFLIGDFTAQIGDPTGRKKARMQLSQEEVISNAKTYQDQVFKILDEEKTKIVTNSSWLSEIKLNQFLGVLMHTTLVQLLSREDFSARFHAEEPIYMHEYLYPILQGYDSVAMKADIELGGTDQKFNLLMGRHLQKSFGMSQQALIILPILEGLDGVQKMSKSFDNAISLTDSPKDMFGKIMSVSDQLMIRYFELVSTISTDGLTQLKRGLAEGTMHPMSAKKQLAQEIVDRYHGQGSGSEERQRFEELFSKKTQDADLPLVELAPEYVGEGNLLNLVLLLVGLNFVKSKSDARRLIQQNAIKLDGKAINTDQTVLEKDRVYLLKAGKIHHVKIKLS